MFVRVSGEGNSLLRNSVEQLANGAFGVAHRIALGISCGMDVLPWRLQAVMKGACCIGRRFFGADQFMYQPWLTTSD